MLKIRLARVGKRKRPTYRIIISEAARDTYGRALEIMGHYNPLTKVCDVKKDRVLYWISQGAKVSPTLNNLLIDQNVLTGEKVRASKSKKKGAADQTSAPAAAAVKPTPAAPAEEKPTPAAPAEEKPAEPEAKPEEKPAEKPAEALVEEIK